jgi:hypothetical protein
MERICKNNWKASVKNADDKKNIENAFPVIVEVIKRNVRSDLRQRIQYLSIVLLLLL